MSTFHVYSVLRDHNRHHCICVGVERKYTYFIPMAAAEVKVDALVNEEFKQLYEECGYPVRRAAEIFLASPDKEVSPKAREHLEAILADPAYVYDRSLYPEPHVLKEKLMATASKKATSAVNGRRKTDSAAHEEAAKVMAAAGPIVSKAAKKAPVAAVAATPAKKGAVKAAAAKGRVPAMDPSTKVKVGNAEAAKRGYMLEFMTMAQAMDKASRGKGVTIEALVEGGVALPGAKDKDAAWVRTYVSYAMAPNREMLVVA